MFVVLHQGEYSIEDASYVYATSLFCQETGNPDYESVFLIPGTDID